MKNNDDYSSRVYRGGGWNLGPRVARVADRGWFAPSVRYADLGFRLSRLVNNLEQLSEMCDERQQIQPGR
jgi:formylglycine-generating enzyme required for sulfatase activity